MKIYRQGDILVKEANYFPDLVDCKQSIEGPEMDGYVILALGEATGHKHKLSNENALLKKSANTNRFFLVVTKESDITHEEHNSIPLPPGNYEVIRQRVYEPTGIRTVID